MQEIFEKIIEKLEEKIKEYDERIERRNGACYFDETDKIRKLDDTANGIEQAIEIVKQEAEQYNNGWIPCSERLPEECIEVLVSVKEIDDSFYTITSWVQDGVWVIKKTPLQPTVIAWQPLPQPFQKGE